MEFVGGFHPENPPLFFIGVGVGGSGGGDGGGDERRRQQGVVFVKEGWQRPWCW